VTTTINFHKVNYSFAKLVSADAGALRSLREYFTFAVPGAHFSPKVRQGFWDGKMRLLKPNGTIYYGLKWEIMKFCDDRGWEFIDHDIQDNTFPTSQQVLEFCQSLNLQSEGKPIEVRDYQLRYITHALQNARGVLLCPTSGGKSLIAYVIVRWALAHGLRKGLLTVPSINLVEQMYTDFLDYGWDREMMHKIYEGAVHESDAPLTISTWQGIQNETTYFQQFDFMIGDEAHLYKAKSLVGIMEHLNQAAVRIGMSGTLDGLTTSQMTLEGLFGPCFRVIKTQELIEQGYSSEFEIKCVVMRHSDTVRKHFTELKLDYDKECEFLRLSPKRTQFIARLALSKKGNSIVFFQHREHGQLLYEALRSFDTTNRKIYYIDGNTKVAERERIRREVETTHDTILVASYGTSSTGANYKSIHNMFFASAYKSLVRTLQSIGRGLRKSQSKTKCTLYDLADDLSWGDTKVRENYTLQHFKDRLGIYSNEGFLFKVMELEI
jgi:superfamily II DNA or RNA helicase